MAPSKKPNKGRKSKASNIQRNGYVLNDEFHCLEKRGNGRVCGATMANVNHNISSHFSKFHKVNSAHSKNRKKGEPWPCFVCGAAYSGKNFHSLENHLRNIHGYDGASAPWKVASIALRNAMRAVAFKGKASGEQKNQQQDEDDEDSDDDLFVPHDRAPDRDPPDQDHSRGPGAAGAPIAV